MKRGLAALFLVCLLLFLTACSAGPAVSEIPEVSATAEPIVRTESIVVAKSTLDMLDLNISVMSRKLQLYNVTENADGSCTVHMTQEEKKAMISALRSALDEEMKSLAADGTWPFLKRVEISEDGSTAHLYTSAEQYDPIRDRACADSVYLPVLLYVAFSQPEAANEFTMQFTVLDETERMLDYFKYPKKEVRPSASSESAGMEEAAE